MTTLSVLLTACFAHCAAVTAQQVAAPPRVAHVVTVGPAEWRARLGPTNLGSMLAAEDAAALWHGYVDRLDAALREMRGEDAAFARERERLLAYAGVVHVLVWLERAEDAIAPARWSMAWIAEPDGHTDLAAMAAACATWLARLETRVDAPWRELRLSPPRLVGDRLVAVLAEPQDAAAAAARAAAFRAGPPARPAVLRAEVDVQTALGLLRDRAAQRGFAAALLGAGTRHASLVIGAAGPRVLLELGAAFGPGDRGLFDGLYPATQGIPDLAHLVPDGTATSFAWRLDLPELWRRWLQVLAVTREREPDALRQEARARYGCDLAEDLLAQCEGSALLLWRASADDEPDDTAPLANACFVVPLRDEPAFREQLRTVLRRLGHRPHEDDDGALRANLGSYQLAVDGGVVCLALGGHAREHTKAVLERTARTRSTRAAPPPPAGAPPGCNGLGRCDVSTLVLRDLYGQLRWVLWLVGGMRDLPAVSRIATEAERWLPLLREYGLGHATSTAGRTEDDWRLRLLW